MRHKIKSVMISYNFSFFFPPFSFNNSRYTRATLSETLFLNPILHTINQWLPTNGISTRAYF